MNLIVCYTVNLIGLALLLFNVISYLKYRPKSIQVSVLSIYLTASFLESSICFALFHFWQINNFFLSHIFFAVQWVFLSYFYFSMAQNSMHKEAIKYVASVLFFGIVLQYLLYPIKFWEFNLTEILVVSTLLICFALLHIYYNLGFKKQFFYFSIGLLLYFICSSIIYMFGNIEIVFLQDPLVDLWVVKDIFFIFFQILVWKELKYIKNNHDE
jgi:hypothetical protein